ncbi:MAG: hypothetical protein ACREDF_04900 [Thermoplasmata archaeon]
MSARLRSVRRARRQRACSLRGFLVTWDVDSNNASGCAQVRRFIFGYTLRNNGTTYRYPGFVERAGVRYIGQSVLFVTGERLDELRAFLRSMRVQHVVTDSWIGGVMPN